MGTQFDETVTAESGQLVVEVKGKGAVLVEDVIQAQRHTHELLEEVGRFLDVRFPTPTTPYFESANEIEQQCFALGVCHGSSSLRGS